MLRSRGTIEAATSDRPRIAPLRATGVTAGLVLTGAAVGAALGTALASLMFALGPGGPSLVDLGLGLIFGGSFGAATGAVGAPVLAWGLLRYVPLGRAIGWTAAGTVVGCALGLLTHWHPALSGVLGFVAGAVAARLATPKPRPADEPPLGTGRDDRAA